MVTIFASQVVCRGFVPQRGHTQDHHKNVTNYLPAWCTDVRVGVWQCNLPVKGRIVCGLVYGDMHLKDLLGSIARVGYCIPILDLYLVLHGL